MTYTRRLFLAGLTALLVLPWLSAGPAAAHHGWRWAEDENFEITGIITEAKLGNPHGLLTLDVKGETWTAEVGQPWRNDRAGLTDAMLSPGKEVTIRGHRSKDPKERLIKAERVIIGGKVHDLYPDRQ